VLKNDWHTIVALVIDSAFSPIRLADNLDDFKVEAFSAKFIVAA